MPRTRTQTRFRSQRDCPYWLVCVKDSCRLEAADGSLDYTKIFLPAISDQIWTLYDFCIPETCMNGGLLSNHLLFFVCDSEQKAQSIKQAMYPDTYTIQRYDNMDQLILVDSELQRILASYFE